MHCTCIQHPASAFASGAAMLFICLLCLLTYTLALDELSIARMRTRTESMVALVYDPEVAEEASKQQQVEVVAGGDSTQIDAPPIVQYAMGVMEKAERRMPHYKFYYANARSPINRRLASELGLVPHGDGHPEAEAPDWAFLDSGDDLAGVPSSAGSILTRRRSGVHVFVRTPEDGVEEYRLPLSAPRLLRYLHLRGVVGNPADVRRFRGRDAFHALYKPGAGGGGEAPSAVLPVLAAFVEPWCAHCYRLRRAFEAGASFFRGRVRFVQVDCGASAAATAFCDEEAVGRYPLLRLYAAGPDGRGRRLDYEGSRAVAAWELFFHVHRNALHPNSSGEGRPADSPRDVVPPLAEALEDPVQRARRVGVAGDRGDAGPSSPLSAFPLDGERAAELPPPALGTPAEMEALGSPAESEGGQEGQGGGEPGAMPKRAAEDGTRGSGVRGGQAEGGSGAGAGEAEDRVEALERRVARLERALRAMAKRLAAATAGRE